MNREHEINRIRHYGRLPPEETSDRGVANGADNAQPSSKRSRPQSAGWLRGETEEVGLTLDLPCHYRSLLVPLDGGPFAEHALPLALGIARRAGAEVRVVHVHCPLQSACRPETLHYDSALDVSLRRRQRAYLDDLLRHLARVTTVPVTPVLLQGREVTEALSAAGVGTDLVVMATHGRGPLGRLWFGSVAEQLMRRLSVPLLLVRGHNAPADATDDPLIRNVVIAVDGSADAEEILEPAMALGTLTDARYTLVHVVDPATVPDYEFRDWWGPLDSHLKRLPPQATTLRAVAERLAKEGARVNALVLFDKDPARAILRYARDHDADLIALAARDRGGLLRFFRGGVAGRVIRGAGVPVLTICASGERGGRAIP